MDVKAGRDQAFPGALVLPPGVVTDHSRWLDTWPELGPFRAFGWLGLAADAIWEMVVEAAYARRSGKILGCCDNDRATLPSLRRG